MAHKAKTVLASARGALAKAVGKKKNVEKRVDASLAPVLQSPQQAEQPAALTPPQKEQRTMTLTLKGLGKSGKQAFYTGAAVILSISLSAFPDKKAPQTIEIADGIFAGAKQPKAKLTPAERKAARDAAPKLTLAEKVRRAEANTAKLREKLAKAGQPGI